MTETREKISPIGEKPATVRPMNKAEARMCARAIRGHFDSARGLVLELYDREGWKALGYGSWRECVVTEFDQSKTHLYRQLEAAQIEREISPIGEIGAIPESHLRPLAPLPEGERKPAWEEANRTAPEGKLTGRHVAETVEKIRSPEPPDIAAQRKSGVIPEGVPVVVEDVDPRHEDEPPGVLAEVSDKEFLEDCPARAKLTEPCRKVFDRDALLFRGLADARDRFARVATRFLSANRKAGPTGNYHFYLTSFLSSKHPRHWLVCADCKGSGQVRLIGKCPNCHGLGYKA